MIAPREAYRRLLQRYGPRGWWPVTPPGAGSPRYHPGRFTLPGPRGTSEICLGAILTQNTAWSNVVTALERLHAVKAMDPRAVMRLRPASLQKLIRTSGYFVQKAIKLKHFSRHVLARGVPMTRWMRETPLPALREELLDIHGVGPETADSMLLYAGGRRVFVVDAYTKRIGSRLGWYPGSESYAAVQAFFTERLPRSVKVYQEYHALFVELGKRVCRPRPLCGECPLRTACPQARREH